MQRRSTSRCCKTLISTNKVNVEPVSLKPFLSSNEVLIALIPCIAQSTSVALTDSPPAVLKPKAPTKTSAGQSVANFYGTGTRTSARTANRNLGRKELKLIEMEKGDKVKDLKPKVSRVFSRLRVTEGLTHRNSLGSDRLKGQLEFQSFLNESFTRCKNSKVVKLFKSWD